MMVVMVMVMIGMMVVMMMMMIGMIAELGKSNINRDFQDIALEAKHSTRWSTWLIIVWGFLKHKKLEFSTRNVFSYFKEILQFILIWKDNHQPCLEWRFFFLLWFGKLQDFHLALLRRFVWSKILCWRPCQWIFHLASLFLPVIAWKDGKPH